MLKKSFNAFRTRSADNSIGITTFEKNNNILVPPLFKLFITYFEWEKGTIPEILEYNSIEHDKSLVEIGVAYPTFSPRPYFYFDEFFSLQKGVEIRDKLYSKGSNVFSKGYFPIGMVDGGHSCLMLGVNQDNLDNIFIEAEMYDHEDNPTFEKIADNIFDLVHSIHYEINVDTLSSTELSQIYKKWDDEKWYGREDVKDFTTLTEKRRMERKNHPEKFD